MTLKDKQSTLVYLLKFPEHPKVLHHLCAPQEEAVHLTSANRRKGVT